MHDDRAGVVSSYHRLVVNDWCSVMGDNLVVRSLVMDNLSVNDCLVVRYHRFMMYNRSLVDNS